MRVLQILPGLKTDGIAVVVTNYYKFADKTRVQFDFAVENKNPNKYDDYINQSGGRIFRLPNHISLPFGAISYCKALIKLIKKERYPVVHVHSNASILLFLAGVAVKLAGVGSKLVFSSHSTSCETKGLHRFLKPFIQKMAALRLACSQEAGIHMYGNNEFSVLPNAIDFEKYSFNQSDRERVRKELALEDRFVVGFSGRIAPLKNPLFLLDVFKQLRTIVPSASLLVCGDGVMMGEVLEKVKNEEISDAIFLGSVSSTETYLSAMDVCLFPSFYEGFSIALLEAEANGLPCICSENIPELPKFSEKTVTIPLNQKGKWVETLVELANNSNRVNCEKDLENTIFDIRSESKKLLDCYVSLANKD